MAIFLMANCNKLPEGKCPKMFGDFFVSPKQIQYLLEMTSHQELGDVKHLTRTSIPTPVGEMGRERWERWGEWGECAGKTSGENW